MTPIACFIEILPNSWQNPQIWWHKQCEFNVRLTETHNQCNKLMTNHPWRVLRNDNMKISWPWRKLFMTMTNFFMQKKKMRSSHHQNCHFMTGTSILHNKLNFMTMVTKQYKIIMNFMMLVMLHFMMEVFNFMTSERSTFTIKVMWKRKKQISEKKLQMPYIYTSV